MKAPKEQSKSGNHFDPRVSTYADHMHMHMHMLKCTCTNPPGNTWDMPAAQDFNQPLSTIAEDSRCQKYGPGIYGANTYGTKYANGTSAQASLKQR
jgi:hypothetical protein